MINAGVLSAEIIHNLNKKDKKQDNLFLKKILMHLPISYSLLEVKKINLLTKEDVIVRKHIVLKNIVNASMLE